MITEDSQKGTVNLQEAARLTRELFHVYYAGEPEQWLQYLCPESTYLGTGESMLFGANEIQEHFKGMEGKSVDVVQEEYHPVSFGDTAAYVCGQITVKSKKNHFEVVDRFTVAWRFISGGLKIVHLHNSYEYTQPSMEGVQSALKMDMRTTAFYPRPAAGTARQTAHGFPQRRPNLVY